jgi:hypothetical protein
MKEVYTIITATLGVPPPANEKFVYDYYDKDNKSIKWVGTPVEFYRVRVLPTPYTLEISCIWDARMLPLGTTLPRIHFPSSMTQGMSTANFTPSKSSETSGVGDLSSVRRLFSLFHNKSH